MKRNNVKMQEKQSKTRVKHLLMVHLIFVVKYRKPLASVYAIDIKQKAIEISKSSRFEIDTMEIDKDHIHFLIRYDPNISISQIVRKLKSEITYDLWNKYPSALHLEFWKRHIFWSPSYFCCSLGDISQDTARKYIESQG